MRKTLALAPALAWGQTTEELYNDGKNPDNVLTQSMGFARSSYSPLAHRAARPNLERESNERCRRTRGSRRLRRRCAIKPNGPSRSTSRPAAKFGARPCSTNRVARVRPVPSTAVHRLFRVTADNHLVARPAECFGIRNTPKPRKAITRVAPQSWPMVCADFRDERRRVDDAGLP
jgi:hypothetical protein